MNANNPMQLVDKCHYASSLLKSAQELLIRFEETGEQAFIEAVNLLIENAMKALQVE